MRRFLRINPLIALVLLLSSCTGGGSGGGGATGSGNTGGFGVTGGGSSGGGGNNTTTGGGDTIGSSDTGGTTTGGTTTTGGSSTGGSNTGGGSGGGEGTTTTATLNIDASSGRASFPYTIPFASGTGFRVLDLTIGITSATAFQNVATYKGKFLATSTLVAPNGATVVPGPSNLLTTAAIIPSDSVNTLNYQTRAADPAVTPGNYKQRLLYDAGGPANATGVLLAKNDANLTAGSLVLNIFLVGNEVQKTTNRQVIEEAITAYKAIFSSIGIAVNESYTDVNSTFGVLPNPILGSSFYGNLASGVGQLSLNMFIGETISADNTQNVGNELDGVVGIASNIPGPAVATDFSAVVVSLTQHQGPDGQFSQEEKSVFAETMAHECGHYLGLFHPVESSFDEFDPLDDTATCTSLSQCITNGIAGNLMYPSVVPGVIQRNLTSDQRRVVNRNIMVE